MPSISWMDAALLIGKLLLELGKLFLPAVSKVLSDHKIGVEEPVKNLSEGIRKVCTVGCAPEIK